MEVQYEAQREAVCPSRTSASLAFVGLVVTSLQLDVWTAAHGWRWERSLNKETNTYISVCVRFLLLTLSHRRSTPFQHSHRGGYEALSRECESCTTDERKLWVIYIMYVPRMRAGRPCETFHCPTLVSNSNRPRRSHPAPDLRSRASSRLQPFVIIDPSLNDPPVSN